MKPATASIIGIMVVTFIVTFDGAAVQMALPVLAVDLQAPVSTAQWIMTSFLLVSSAALLPAGRAGDLHGHARVWRTGALLFSAASALCAVAPGVWWLVGFRAVQGFAAALTGASSAALLVESFPGEKRGEALGIAATAIAIGLVAGPPTGAFVTDYISWRFIFFVGMPGGVAAWWVSRRTLPRSEVVHERMDYSGAVLSVAALGGVLTGGTFGDRWGWGTAQTIAPITVGVIAGVIFVLREQRARKPMLDLGLFGRRAFASGASAALLTYAALFSLTFTMPFFLLVAQQRPLIQAGMIVGIVPLSLSAVAPLAGALSARLGTRFITTSALACISVALTILLWAEPDSGLGLLGPALVLTGLGVGAFQAPNVVEVLGQLEEKRLGIATATLQMMRNLGMTFGIAASATLLDIHLRRVTGSAAERATAGFHLAMGVAIAFAVGGLIASALQPGRMLPHRASDGGGEPHGDERRRHRIGIERAAERGGASHRRGRHRS